MKIGINGMIRSLSKRFGGADGFFLIEAAYNAVYTECRGKIKHIRLYKMLSEYLSKSDERVEEDALISVLSKESEITEITYKELYSVPCYLRLIAISRLYADNTKSGDDPLEACLSLIRSINNIDLEKLINSVSLCEKFLVSNDPVYMMNDDKTKGSCRENIAYRSKAMKITELEAARKTPSSELYRYRLPLFRRYYFYTVYLLPAFVAVLLLAFGIPVLSAVLLLFPLTELIKQLVDSACGKIVKSRPVPRLKLRDIPDDAATVVAITTIISEENLDDMFSRLESYSLCNDYSNLRFALLCDFSDSSELKEDTNNKIREMAVSRLNELNLRYGHRFFLFIRPAAYSHNEKAYMGWERKRGAIVELVGFMKDVYPVGGNGFETCACDNDFMKRTKYLITLDSDTRLYPGSVLDMVGAMAHPANKPKTENGIVTKGYGVMQPRTEASLESALKTKFTMINDPGGSDVYSSALYETYMSLYGEGIFCGKGIIDVEAFAETVINAFPENLILSHDILEGAYLRTAALTDVSLTDGSPKNSDSYFKRQHRWIRGDVQTAFYVIWLRLRYRREKKKQISRLSFIKIIDNVRRALVPFFAVSALISTVFLEWLVGEIVAALSLLFIIYRPVYTAFDAPHCIFRRFFGLSATPLKRSFVSSLLEISSLGYAAFISLDAVFRSLFRLFFTRKKLLEWTTADAENSKRSDFINTLGKTWPSAILGLALIVFSKSVLAAAVGTFWAIFPFAAYYIGKELKRNEKISLPINKEVIKKYVFDMWRFFDASVTKNDNFLPPDNRQLSPVEATAHRTSPTNIGLYLLSCLAVRDFGFIDTGELYSRVNNTVSTVEKLAKFSGHLYNWYDTETLQVIGQAYVSTVDSGNFVTSLLALEKGLVEYLPDGKERSELLERIVKLRRDCDFGILYNQRKKLFSIGFDTLRSELSENCYDLYMSESRTTSYYAIAQGIVPREHWSALGRPFISDKGYTGTASWTGTMFEYFMPSLLLPSPIGTFSRESLEYALFQQKRERCHGIWGRSESGYYAFDQAMNYLYRAFGVKKLGIKPGLEKDKVISPYSSFLVMWLDPKGASKNLEKMKLMGLYGDYGFYEAIDFTPRRLSGRDSNSAVIRSYMTHHTAMSIIASANACFDDIFVKRFFSDPKIKAACELLEEKVNVWGKTPKIFAKRNDDRIPYKTNKQSKSKDKQIFTAEDNITVLSNGQAKITASSKGEIRLECGEDALTSDPFEIKNPNRLRIFTEIGGNGIDITENPDMRYDRSEIVFKKTAGKARFTLRLRLHPNYKCFLISLEAENVYGSVCPMLTFEPLLCNYKTYRAHPAFTALSLEADYLKDDGVVAFKRLTRSKDEPERSLCIGFESSGQSFDFLTRKDPSLPLMYNDEDIKNLLSVEFDNYSGPCITPFCAIKKRSDNVGGRYCCDFLISYGQTQKESVSVIRSIRSEAQRVKKKTKYKKLPSQYLNLFTLPMNLHSINDFENKRLIRTILNCAVRRKFSNGPMCGESFGLSSIWRYGLSGDNPIVTLNFAEAPVYGDNASRIAESFINAHRHIMLSGIRFDIALLYKSNGEYVDKTKNLLLELIDKSSSPFLSAKNGGVFIIDVVDPETKEIFKACSVYYKDIDRNTVEEALFSGDSGSFDRSVMRDGSEKLFLPSETVNIQPRTSIRNITEKEDDVIDVFSGRFKQDGFEVLKKSTSLPWSYVYANPTFGTLITQNSLGYTWKGNCHSKRITPWNGDGYSEPHGERLILTVGDESYDMCSCAERVTFGYGFAEYIGVCGGVKYSVKVGVDRGLPVKMIAICTNGGKVSFEFEPLMSNDFLRAHTIQTKYENGILCFRNQMTQDFEEYGFLYRIESEKEKKNDILTREDIKNEDNSKEGELGSEICFLLGAFPRGGEATVKKIIEKYRDASSVRSGFCEYEKNISSHKTDLILKSRFPALDVMVNRYLPYQIKTVRMTARCGFYQSGGAYGFRDQLQDSLGALYFDLDVTKRQIIRCACHQYSEGDVMHWWHESRHRPFGVRTRCSDDYLWLPYSVARYVKHTGDYSLLDRLLPYVESPSLKEGENERCERPGLTLRKESLYLHCIRAIELGLSKKGKHGLPLIGSGDWNDGMNTVGIEGLGESVWLGFFLTIVLCEFSELCKIMGDSDTSLYFESERKNIISALDRAWEKDRFLRAYYDDGTPLGSENSTYCKIDALPQAFSALTDGIASDKVKAALETAKNHLYDPSVGIFKLFTPPFERDDGEKNTPGYIEGYVPGVRENGGQYTHGAVWAAWAYLRSGDVKFGTELLMKINPAMKYISGDGKIYRGEPYFLAGDVYSHPDYSGRAGWTLYTGAASWYYGIVVSELLGIVCLGDDFTVNPRLSQAFPWFELTLRRGETEYIINASIGDKNEFILDGKAVCNGFRFDEKMHILKITVENTEEIV